MRPALSALLFLATAAQADARTLSGELTHRAPVQLSPGAQMVIELVAPDGSLVTLRQATGGRQVPVPFQGEVPDTVLRLRASVVENGATTWISGLIDIPEGTEDKALGPIMIGPYVPDDALQLWACGRNLFRFGTAGQMARLERGTDLRVLAAAGTGHSDGQSPETSFTTDDRTATITWDGAALPACTRFPTPDLVPLRAAGNEPGWRLDAARDGVTFTSEPGGQGAGPLPAPVLGAAGLTYTPAAGLAFTLSPGPCYDTMTGMPHPLSVTVESGGEIYLGCGGDAETMIEGTWRVAEIEGTPVPEGAEVTMQFVRGGELGGKAACNRYTSGYRLTGEGLTFTPAAATRMACAQALMQLESTFLAVLPGVTHFDIRDGALILMAGDRPALRLHR
jgi:heat shock protein HslJ